MNTEKPSLVLNTEKTIFFANNTECPFLTLFHFWVGTIAYLAVIALKTQKNEPFLKKSTVQKITLRKMQRIRIQSFFLNGLSAYIDLRILS